MTTSARARPAVDLVVFSCEGREALLLQTLASFESRCPFAFRRRLLALDGPFRTAAIASVRADLVVQSRARRGYVQNILNAMALVETEFCFWLEDDWSFEADPRIEVLASALTDHPDWLQVRLSKVAPLADLERSGALAPGYFESGHGFSANPSLNRTAGLREAFAHLRMGPRHHRTGFEDVVSTWAAAEGCRCAVVDPGQAAAVTHQGALESTPRQYHMTASLDDAPQPHLYSLGTTPGIRQRILMAARVIARASIIAARQLVNNAYYELGFRLTTLPLPVPVCNERLHAAASRDRRRQDLTGG